MQVSIDRCFFRGSEEAIASARESLEKSRFPAIGDSEFVIIRRLSIAAETSQLEKHYFRQTQRLLASKINGWSEDAANGDCVWFASETDLYACLCRDIALGRVDGLWYWKQFGHLASGTPSQRLVHVMVEQASQLPALIAQLVERDCLFVVWRQLTTQERLFLFQEIVPRNLVKAIEAAAGESLQAAAVATSGRPLPALLATLLSDIGPTDNGMTQETGLAIALFLLSSRPHQAISQHPVAAVRKLAGMIVGSGLMQQTPAAKPATTDKGLNRTETASKDTRDQQAAGSVEEPAEPLFETGQSPMQAPQKSGVVSRDEADGGNGTESQAALPAPEPLLEPDRSDSGKFSSEPAATANESPSTDQWSIAQGGLFYLINLLNQPVIRDLLLKDPEAVAFPSGWGWLYRFGERLGLQYERELVRCLARLSDMDEKAFLDETPRLDAAADILAFAEQRYMQFGIWHASLLQKAAYVDFLRPEVTVSYNMRDIDIELRKSGLDIDPGWVDWLGSMVRFRYREFL